MLETKYLESTDEDGRSVMPVTVLEVSRIAPAQLVPVHEIILPLAFMGARDTSVPALAKVWAQVWEENTGGSTTAIRKWRQELFSVCSGILRTHPSWTMKRQVGKALTDIATALGDEVEPIMSNAVALLVDSLSGRTWDGKEAVLEALASMSKHGHKFFLQHPQDLKTVEDVFLRECSKQNLAYKRYAVEYMGLVFERVPTERYAEMLRVLIKAVQVEEDDDAMDVDDEKRKPMVLSIQANAFLSIGLSFPHTPSLQPPFVNEVGTLLGRHLISQVWNIRLAILEGLRSFLEKLDPQHSMEQSTLDTILDGCLACLLDGKYRSVRESSARVLLLLAPRDHASERWNQVRELGDAERDVAIQGTLRQALASVPK
jgi:proteasome component ECM29